MSGKSLVDQIKHYQKDIERCPDNTERMIRCIQRLYVLPVKVEHLQETGVGRSVNSLRKYKGEVGDAAKALVAKWKAMVADEESSDETQDVSMKKSEPKVSSPPPSPAPLPSKHEQKSDRHSPKDKSSNKNHSSDSKKHHNDKKLHNSDSKSSSSEKKSHNSESKSNKSECKSHKSESKARSSDSKPYNSEIKSSSSVTKSNNSVTKPHRSSSSSNSKARDKQSESKSSSSKKIQESPSPTGNHVSERKSSSHKNHKSNHDKKRKSDSDESPPHKKHKQHHHHHSKSHSSSKRKSECLKSDSEDESSSSDESYASAVSDVKTSQSENESVHESENSNSGNDSDSDSSSDHRHRSNHKSSHHKQKHSSHSKEKAEEKNKETTKEKERHKDRNHSKNDKHSSKSTSSPGYKELIRENEKKIKKEKGEGKEFAVPKKVHSNKPIKLETNEDGSIDSGSGASFADLLLGIDTLTDTKKKKKPLTSGSSSTSGKTSSKSFPKNSSHSSSSKSDGYSSKLLKASVSPSSSSSSSPSKARSIDELVEPPELLTKRVKLEALDFDISSTLPEINPNYKPLPHVPESARRQSKTMSEEAMFNLMTSKNQRTKVYSGNKVYQSTIPTLFSLCIQLLYDNIDAMEYTGGIPYNILKPLLERLNADQLYVLEHFNPYLIEDTDELWKFHCTKDFRSEKRQDMESWRELYLRCLEERERKLKALTANITQSMAKSTPVRHTKLAYVDSVVKPPRNVARKQAKFGTGNSTTSSSKNPTKLEIVNKAFVGGNTPGVSADEVVPIPRPVARAAAHHPTPALIKKKKAPLMQKALQVMKGTRYKR